MTSTESTYDIIAHLRQGKGAGPSTVIGLVGDWCNNRRSPVQFRQGDLETS